MNKNDYTIRLEKCEDYHEVENLVREAFWSVYRPGCSEHYVIHVLRNDPAFVKELDFVMERNGELIGQNMFMKTVIDTDDKRTIPVLTMGPYRTIRGSKRWAWALTGGECPAAPMSAEVRRRVWDTSIRSMPPTSRTAM